MVRRSALEQIFHELMLMRYRMDDIEKHFAGIHTEPIKVEESLLLSLPDHLRTTYMALASKGEAQAAVISTKTGKTRAIESTYLNQLCRMGYIRKERRSKTMYFTCSKLSKSFLNNNNIK
jgi:hypothetical protein